MDTRRTCFERGKGRSRDLWRKLVITVRGTVDGIVKLAVIGGQMCSFLSFFFRLCLYGFFSFFSFFSRFLTVAIVLVSPIRGFFGFSNYCVNTSVYRKASS